MSVVDSVRHGGIDQSGQIVIEAIRLFHERSLRLQLVQFI
jgi:hypothetical protein